MKKIYLSLISLVITHFAFSQSFTANASLVPGTFHSGGCTGVTDMNNDGLDDIVILDQSTDLNIAYQQSNGTFNVVGYGTVSNGSQWGMCIGDVDNDGHKDVLCGGYYDNVHIVNIDSPNIFVQQEYAWANIFAQGCNIADIDNDGWLDAFVCHDDGHSAILHNDGTGFMTNGASLMDLTFYPEVSGGNDNSGNYGTVWTDFDRDGDVDLFIAKCRQFINDPYDPRRTNILMVNDGNGNYSDEAAARGLINLQQSWTSDFADMDNDGDFDCLLTTHSNTLEIYANDGLGYFTNVTAGSGLDYAGFFLQAKMVDFDNDGFVDLVHAGGEEGYCHNNGNMTFTKVANTFVNNDIMHSFAIGDLNHDGYLDLFASYGDGYVDPDPTHADKFFINDGGDKNFIVFDLEGTISNKDAQGALVEIHGAWGVQIREVRDGESYGITNQSMCHFGIGNATSVDYALIHWPSGLTTTIDNPSINTWYNVIEGQCYLGAPNITAQGGTTFCPGDNVTLTVNNTSLNYTWNTGATTSSVTVSDPGNYFVSVSDANGCEAISQSIHVDFATLVTPTISATGDLHICDNTTLTLTASEGNAYVWNTGETTQSVAVSAPGDYSVQVEEQCGLMSSGSITITVSAAPVNPSVTDVNIDPNSSAVFNVTGGTNIEWFDSANSTTPIATGNSFTTPALNANTSYWVQDMLTYPGDVANGGKAVWTENASGQYQNSSTYYLIFDVLENITINSVKVYANGAGDRTIGIFDSAGNSIAQGTFTMPDGESVVNVNFSVPAGTDYSFRCIGNNPQLWRDKDLTTAFAYPFNISNLVSITHTNVNGADTDNYYYYFYDWQVQTPDFTCPSDRIEVQAIIIAVEELENVNSLNVYPNPASDVLNIAFSSATSAKMIINVMDQAGRIVLNKQITFSPGMNNQTIDVSALSAGIYELQFIENGQSMTRKVVIK